MKPTPKSRSTRPYPKTPTLDKMLAAKDRSQVIGKFLEHLSNECIHLAEYVSGERRGDDAVLVPINKSIEQVLAYYFDVDLNKVEQERQEILSYIHSQS